MSRLNRVEARRKRHERIRRKVNGTAERPRLAIMISRRRIYVQFIDDTKGVTLLSVCTTRDEGHNVAAARLLGERAAKAGKEKGITQVVVDRGGFKYHGRVKALADALAAGGVSKGITRERPVETEKEPDGKKEKAAKGAPKSAPGEQKKKPKGPREPPAPERPEGAKEAK